MLRCGVPGSNGSKVHATSLNQIEIVLVFAAHLLFSLLGQCVRITSLCLHKFAERKRDFVQSIADVLAEIHIPPELVVNADEMRVVYTTAGLDNYSFPMKGNKRCCIWRQPHSITHNTAPTAEAVSTVSTVPQPITRPESSSPSTEKPPLAPAESTKVASEPAAASSGLSLKIVLD
jgi:hypothetical protein